MNVETNNLAFVFPGQGSQTVGMLAELAVTFPIIKQTFAEASDVLHYDLWALTQNGPEEQLHKTEFAQPALLSAGVALWRAWGEHGGQTPQLLAGHSLGEYTALTCAGAFEFSEAILLVADRGRYMQAAFTGASAMVAVVGLDDITLQSICHEAAANQVLVPANYNSIGQTVLSGELDAATRAVELAKKAGAKIAKILPVSIPSHCALMRPAADLLSQRLAAIDIKIPKINVIQNAEVAIYQEPQQIRDALVRQLYSPVRWVETVQLMVTDGIDTVLECGPGKVLTGLNKRINNNIGVDTLTNRLNSGGLN